MTGIVGNQWTLREFAPMNAIPAAIYLTSYSGDTQDFMRTPLDELANQVEAGKLRIKGGKVSPLDQIAETHRAMEEDKAEGTIVFLM